MFCAGQGAEQYLKGYIIEKGLSNPPQCTYYRLHQQHIVLGAVFQISVQNYFCVPTNVYKCPLLYR